MFSDKSTKAIIVSIVLCFCFTAQAQIKAAVFYKLAQGPAPGLAQGLFFQAGPAPGGHEELGLIKFAGLYLGGCDGLHAEPGHGERLPGHQGPDISAVPKRRAGLWGCLLLTFSPTSIVNQRVTEIRVTETRVAETRVADQMAANKTRCNST